MLLMHFLLQTGRQQVSHSISRPLAVWHPESLHNGYNNINLLHCLSPLNLHQTEGTRLKQFRSHLTQTTRARPEQSGSQLSQSVGLGWNGLGPTLLREQKQGCDPPCQDSEGWAGTLKVPPYPERNGCAGTVWFKPCPESRNVLDEP